MTRELIEPLALWWRKAAKVRGQTADRVMPVTHEAFEVFYVDRRDRCPLAYNLFIHTLDDNGSYCTRCKALVRP